MLFFPLLACATPDADPDGRDDSAAPVDSASGEPPEPSTDPCERTRAGAASEQPVIVSLSEAHADVRLFGTAEDFPAADAALIAALAASDAIANPDLGAYAAAATDLCVLAAEGGELAAASVESRDGAWWVKPGTGEVTVPDDGQTTVIDLRGLPAVPELDAALREALAASAVGEVTLPSRKVRQWNGYVDQYYSASNVYTVAKVDVAGEVVTGRRSGGALLVVTEDRMAPAAVELAGIVAVGGHGHIVGVDLLTTVAERTWSPVGEQGFSWTSERLSNEENWPDLIEAALRTDDPDADLVGLDPTEFTAFAPGDDDRASIRGRNPYNEPGDPAASLGSYRAALVIAHGGLRRFYPYFDDVGDEIDARLQEVLADDIDASDIWAQRQRLGRLGNALSDGHMFFGYADSSSVVAGFLPVTTAHFDDQTIIVKSEVAGLDPGDVITAIDGVPMAEVHADWLTWHGGATDGYRADLAGRELWYMEGPESITAVDPDGVEAVVDAEPQPVDVFATMEFAWYPRESGTLDDLGYPDVAYLNLAYEITTSMDQVRAALATAATSQGLVVDMRDYPGVNHYDVLAALCPEGYDSPYFRVLTYAGPGEPVVTENRYELEGDDDAYDGPIVLLVSPITVSAAENFSQMLVDAGRVTQVVGGPTSAGTNGNITGFSLPGDFYLSFTGMEVLNPDGSRFHGLGIPVDLVVTPTAADFRDGTDPVLLAGVQALLGD